jgi:hypothetical protein
MIEAPFDVEIKRPFGEETRREGAESPRQDPAKGLPAETWKSLTERKHGMSPEEKKVNLTRTIVKVAGNSATIQRHR